MAHERLMLERRLAAMLASAKVSECAESARGYLTAVRDGAATAFTTAGSAALMLDR